MPALVLLAAVAIAHHSASDDFPKVWDSVATAISHRYYARKSRGPEMDRLLAKYKPIASTARTRDEFEQDVNDMIAEFKDSHFALYTTNDQGYYTMDSLIRGDNAAKMANIGAYFRPSPQGFVVQMVMEESPAQKADIRKGDVVEKADGGTFQPIRSFDGNRTVDLTISRSGQLMNKLVKPSQETAADMFLDATVASERVISDDGRKVGYIHLWTLASDAFREALSDAISGKLANTDACILDLRDGFGGRPERYADPFFRPEMSIEWSTPGSESHEEFGYQRPLIVLINGGSRSAKEVLALILKKSHRATLVGCRTAGNVLGTSPLRVNDWAHLEIPMVDVVTDGVRLEGKGVDPDVSLPQEIDASGKDLYLAKALDMLKNVKARV